MAIVEKINCPDCGSNSTFKTIDGNYKCNYCQGTFIVKEEPQPIKNETYHITSRETYSQTDQDARSKVMRKTLIGAIAAVMVSSLLGLFVFNKSGQSYSNSSSQTKSSYWEEPSVFAYKVLSGSKGTVAWLMTSQQAKMDSVSYILKIMDVKSSRIIKEVPFYKTITYNESFKVSSKIANRFWQYNDIAYAYSEEGGFVGYDIYTYKEIVNMETLQKQFPELKNGISEFQEMNYKNAFKLVTNTAEEYVYYPLTNSIVSKDEDDKSYQTQKVVIEQLYVSDDKQPHIYLMKSKVDKTRDELKISSTVVSGLEESNNLWYKKSFDISSFKKVNDNSYFRALPLCRYNSNLVLMYTSTLAKNATLIIESIDSNGNSTWILKDTVLQHLINNTFADNLYCEFYANQSEVIMNHSNAYAKTISIDLVKGKINWTIDPKILFNNNK